MKEKKRTGDEIPITYTYYIGVVVMMAGARTSSNTAPSHIDINKSHHNFPLTSEMTATTSINEWMTAGATERNAISSLAEHLWNRFAPFKFVKNNYEWSVDRRCEAKITREKKVFAIENNNGKWRTQFTHRRCVRTRTMAHATDTFNE